MLMFGGVRGGELRGGQDSLFSEKFLIGLWRE